jgi:hypothetical protein
MVIVTAAVRIAASMVVVAAAAAAQEHQHPPPVVDHSQHASHEESRLFVAREGSGTAWLPEQTPMLGWHRPVGAWEVMVHGNLFMQFLYEGGEVHRRSRQGGSINWLMGMARRPAGRGQVGVRAMFSAEPWTIPGCGYPDLLATGETCDGDTIHDRQHPHDLFMELAADYTRPLRGGVRWQLYAGLAGEPALGPPGFPHRLSAFPNPVAPIGHHWLDATHITYGVVTTGIAGRTWNVEASAFNGREPDERRYDFDLAAIDSMSARVTIAPYPAVVMQVSAGRLNDAESHGSLPRTDMTRATASVTFHRQVRQGVPLSARNSWATTIAWGLNVETDDSTHAGIIESSYATPVGHTVFGRLEMAGKPAHDLHVHESTDVFTVGKLQLGYTRYFAPRRGVEAGIGGLVSGSAVPEYLGPRYGGRIIPGFGVFLTLRPSGT